MDDVTSTMVVGLVKSLVEQVRRLDEGWSRAFYRFIWEELRYGANASFEADSNVQLINAVKCGPFYDEMNEKGRLLANALGKPRGLFLIVVTKQLDYEIKFEWADMGRWKISKLDGQTGIPQGL